jgi:putative sterol carrier protein
MKYYVKSILKKNKEKLTEIQRAKEYIYIKLSKKKKNKLFIRKWSKEKKVEICIYQNSTSKEFQRTA